MGFTTDNFCFQNEMSPMLDDEEFLFEDPIPTLWEQKKEENPLFLVEGFLSEPKEKQLGGKLNKVPLIRHTILVDAEKLFTKGCEKNYGRYLKDRTMKGIICGYNRLTKEIIEIETIQTVQIFKNEKNNLYLSNNKEEWFCIFDQLIIKESSHNYGQKLFLRFTFEFNNKLYSIDSSNFETISKRAIDKSVQKKYSQTSSSSNSNSKSEKKLIKIEPSMGLKGCLVKLQILNLEKNDSIFIYLGNNFIENFSILKNDLIIFEIPIECEIGKLNLKISLDNGQTFLKSDLKFECIDQNDERGIQKLVNYLIQTSNDKINQSISSQISLENMINKYL